MIYISKPEDMVGKTFDRLTVIGLSHVGSNRKRMWLCSCSCGGNAVVSTSDLNKGHTKSCGCIKRELDKTKFITHGETIGGKLSDTYVAWAAMKQRCNDINFEQYSDYGGRGITICDEWYDFSKFKSDMGDKPAGKSLDRRDNNLGYFKENCKWSTREEQGANKRNNVLLTFNGVTQTMSQWAKELGIKYSTLQARVNTYGWTTERALTTKEMIG